MSRRVSILFRSAMCDPIEPCRCRSPVMVSGRIIGQRASHQAHGARSHAGPWMVEDGRTGPMSTVKFHVENEPVFCNTEHTARGAVYISSATHRTLATL